jgi:DNA-binding MarR family transcriptional regulator
MSEPRWLTDEEQRAWRRLAAVLLRLPAALERQLQGDSRMSHYEYWVIAMLSESPGRTVQLKDLAAMANSSLSRLSHVVSRLEARGWVQRQPCPHDARSTNAILTDAGWDAVVGAAPGHVEAVRSIVFDGLTERDVRDLERVCSVIAERLEEVSGADRPEMVRPAGPA